MQKGSLLLFCASLGIAWVHANTTSSGYCCPQITVALGTEKDGTYNFLAEGNGPAMEECKNACVYSKDSNQTDLYCFKAVASDQLSGGQVQCEALAPYSVLTSTTPTVTGPTTEELLKKIEDLQKDLTDQTKKVEDLEKGLADQTKMTGELEEAIVKNVTRLDQTLATANADISNINTDLAAQTKKTEDLKKEFDTNLTEEVDARKAEDGKLETDISKINTEVDSIDGRLIKTEKQYAVCGYKSDVKFSTATILTFDKIYEEVDSSGGKLEENGTFKAGVAGTYFVTIESGVALHDKEKLRGHLKLSSGNYKDEPSFIYSNNNNLVGDSWSFMIDQASASRYVNMAAEETLHIELDPVGSGEVGVGYTMMCVSLYSASG